MSYNKKELQLDDILSRYLFYRSYINFEEEVVKTSVFKEKHKNGFSVYETTSLSNDEIWKISAEYVEPSYKEQGRVLLGRCDLAVKYYQEAQLTIISKMPPPRHYEVFGMPVGFGLEEAEKLSLRQYMVENSKFVIR